MRSCSDFKEKLLFTACISDACGRFGLFLGPERHRHRDRILLYLDSADSINNQESMEEDYHNKCYCKNDKAAISSSFRGLFPRRLGHAHWINLSAGRSTHTHNVHFYKLRITYMYVITFNVITCIHNEFAR